MKNQRMPLTFDSVEINVLCIMVVQCSNTTFLDPAVKATMQKLADRIKYAVSLYAPEYTHILEDMGDF